MSIKRNAARILVSGACSLVLALGGAGVALAHGGAEVTVTPSQAAPGDTVTITGQGFEAGAEAAVTLEGVKGISPLASLAVAADGNFEGTATVPDLGAGSYQLKAAGGDDAVQIDFTVLAAASVTTVTTATEGTTEPETATTAAGSASETTSATAAMQTSVDASSGPLTYARSTTDTLVAGVVFALVVLVAIVLLVRSSRRSGRSGTQQG